MVNDFNRNRRGVTGSGHTSMVSPKKMRVLALTLVSLFAVCLGGCKRAATTHKDAVTALIEVAAQFPSDPIAGDLKVITNDPQLMAGHPFRPTFLAVFSMLDEQAAKTAGLEVGVAELTFSIFVVGDRELPSDTWEIEIGGRNFSAIKADRHDPEAEISRAIRGRFSKLSVTFVVPRDEVIEAIQDDPEVTLLNTTSPGHPWTFSSHQFAKRFKELRDLLIKEGEPALNWHVVGSELGYRRSGSTNKTESQGAGGPDTHSEAE